MSRVLNYRSSAENREDSQMAQDKSGWTTLPAMDERTGSLTAELSLSVFTTVITTKTLE